MTGDTVACPKCQRKQPKRGGHDTIYFCEHCRYMFDDEPLEGGDYDSRNPAARLEREEYRQAEAAERRRRRR